MKISLEWLNSFLSQPVTADDGARLLTAQGLSVETQQPLAGGDVMLDVEVTSNRPDCLCHVGVAREVAAGSGRAIKPPDPAEPSATGSGNVATVKVEDSVNCPLYTARVIRGVKVGGSPAWLVRRLQAIGLRSINNVVDVTNYVMMELGQPLHAFDLAKLNGKGIIVRSANAGENFRAIDGTKHALKQEMLVIADHEKAVAVAGVMGGAESEVSATTTDVLLESAVFAPLSVRQTSRALKLASDSSYRFERGVDPAGVERASARAAKLIVEVAGGHVEGEVVRVGAPTPSAKIVQMRVARCRLILGMDIEDKEIVEILGKLGLSPRLEHGVVTCVVPTFRLDLTREADLIEEVGRMAGLDRVRVADRMEVVVRPVQPGVAAMKKLRQTLAAGGYLETVTFSFLSPKHGEPFIPPGGEAVRIDDERRKAEPLLRPSVLPSLLVCRKSNQDAGNTGVRLYEVASVWSLRAGVIDERQVLGMVSDAEEAERAVRLVRGTIEQLAGVLGCAAGLRFEPTTAPNFSAAAKVSVGGQRIGVVGLLSSETQKLFDLQSAVAAAELEIGPMLAAYPPVIRVAELPRFPAIERDLSVVVEEKVRWDQIEAQVRETRPAMLEDVRFLVAYRGKPVKSGQKSVSFRMLFRDPAGTLRHEQVDPQVSAVVGRLKAELGAELRA